MRRVFIIRKDLHLSAGKLAAMVGHCCEAYWTNLLKRHFHERNDAAKVECCHCDIDADVWDDYVNGIFTKTICEARNLNNLMKAKAIAEELGLKEGSDYGFINDKCLTELKPENEDGTTTVGMWFAPLADDIAHKISKKFPLLKDHADFVIPLRDREWTINWHKCGDGKEYTFKTRRPTEIDAFNALLQSEQGMCAGNIIVNSLYSESTTARLKT